MMMKKMVMVVFLMALAIGTTEAQNATDTSLKRHDLALYHLRCSTQASPVSSFLPRLLRRSG